MTLLTCLTSFSSTISELKTQILHKNIMILHTLFLLFSVLLPLGVFTLDQEDENYEGGFIGSSSAKSSSTNSPSLPSSLLESMDPLANEIDNGPFVTRTIAREPPMPKDALIRQHYKCSDYNSAYKPSTNAQRMCLPGRPDWELCGRIVSDDLIATKKEAAELLKMMKKVFIRSTVTVGPTIADINSGLLRDSSGVQRLYVGEDRVYFTLKEYKLYGDIFMRAKAAIAAQWGLNNDYLFFSAPTFVTRILGNATFSPREIHDQYWWPHSDKENTPHYDYSGLLYLSDYGIDFTGGLFSFLSPKNETTDVNEIRSMLENGPTSGKGVKDLWREDLIVEPSAGRFVAFTAGTDSIHRVGKVKSGERYVMSMWFTCNEKKHFKKFLDGKEHREFEEFNPQPMVEIEYVDQCEEGDTNCVEEEDEEVSVGVSGETSA